MIEGGRSSPRRRPRRGAVPLAAIAELAGVSSPTVSKVLNGRAGVGPETRHRVEELLREHGYRRTPAPAAPRALEVIFYQMLDSIAMQILRGVAGVAGRHDCTVTFHDVRHEVDAGLPWVDPLLRRHPAGVITVFAGVTAEQGEALVRNGIPMVALDPINDLFPIPAVASANWSGSLAAARHLLDLGHRRIGVLAGPVPDLAARARLDGCHAAFDHAGIRHGGALERYGRFDFESGLDLGRELLALPEPPTAIICADDLQAMGVYEAARQTGMRIPEDLSVVGFDDIEQAAWLPPPLTTVRQPFTEMGATAARVALSLADGEQPGQHRYEVGTSLIIRGSTAPPRRPAPLHAPA